MTSFSLWEQSRPWRFCEMPPCLSGPTFGWHWALQPWVCNLWSWRCPGSFLSFAIGFSSLSNMLIVHVGSWLKGDVELQGVPMVTVVGRPKDSSSFVMDGEAFIQGKSWGMKGCSCGTAFAAIHHTSPFHTSPFYQLPHAPFLSLALTFFFSLNGFTESYANKVWFKSIFYPVKS